jgi:hypothetical protein
MKIKIEKKDFSLFQKKNREIEENFASILKIHNSIQNPDLQKT